MRLRETAVPYVVQEVDYVALRQAIEQTFVDKYGSETLHHVRVAHYNPDIIDVTVIVQARRPEMRDTALELSEELRRQGLRVAIRVVESDTARSFQPA